MTRLFAAIAASMACFRAASAAIDQSTFDNLVYYSQFAAASYCVPNIDPSAGAVHRKITCGVDNTCPQVENNKVEYLSSIYNFGLLDLTSYVAVDPVKKTLVLAFRGADMRGNGVLVPITMTDCKVFCSTCQCWDGFYNAWLSIRDQIVQQLEAAKAAYPDYPLIVAGHSLGGQLSVYAAGELRINGTIWAPHEITMYTYGQPRSGNEDLAIAITKLGNNFRTTHTDDYAPKLGPITLGYRHLSPEYYIGNDNNLDAYPVYKENITVIEGFSNLDGNGGTAGFDMAAHVEYFQAQLTACAENVTRTPGVPYSEGGALGGPIRSPIAV